MHMVYQLVPPPGPTSSEVYCTLPVFVNRTHYTSGATHIQTNVNKLLPLSCVCVSPGYHPGKICRSNLEVNKLSRGLAVTTTTLCLATASASATVSATSCGSTAPTRRGCSRWANASLDILLPAVNHLNSKYIH